METTPLFDTLKDKEIPLAEQVANEISNLIIEQQISEGEKLPNEFELAEQLNVGRGTIREAVKLLVARNVLEIKRGRGTFVAKHTGVVEDPFGFAYIADSRKLSLDLLEMRLLIEPWSAKVAAERATARDKKYLEKACEKAEQELLKGINSLKSDEQFHVTLARCTQSLVLPKIVPVIIYSVHQLGSMDRSSKDYHLRCEQAIASHRKILNAVLAGDGEAAKQAMIEHLENNRYLTK